ncbi:unnamed protein product, partial [marine sediment metagenome]
RIAVMFEGQFMGILSFKEAELEEIGLMMAGSKRVPLESEDVPEG